jgi:RimJ/RimL family protein N-acetyltransferase
MKKSNNSTVTLKPVTESDLRFLYRHLKERDPRANISHKRMPTYSEHVKFVKSRPYSRWYVVIYKNKKIGTVYLTKQNEIGIFIKKNLQDKGLGQKTLELLMKKNPRKRFLANVSPKNKKSIRFFTRNGFKLIQYTYELEPTEN